MSTTAAIPIQEHLRIRGGAQHPGTLAQLVPANYDAAAPTYADVSGLVAWVFRPSHRSLVVELDASQRVSVADAALGLLQIGPIPPAETASLGRRGVYDITLDGVVIIEGTYEMTPSPSRPDPCPSRSLARPHRHRWGCRRTSSSSACRTSTSERSWTPASLTMSTPTPMAYPTLTPMAPTTPPESDMPLLLSEATEANLPALLVADIAANANAITALGTRDVDRLTTQPVAVKAGDTILQYLRVPYNGTVTAADVLSLIAIPTAGTATVLVENLTKSRTIVASIDTRTLPLVLDTPVSLVVSATAPNADVDTGDVIRVTTTFVGTTPEPTAAGTPTAMLQTSLLVTPRSA